MLHVRVLVPHVDRGGANIRMSHHDLEIPEIHVALDAERGESVAAGMRRNALFDAELGSSRPEGLLHRAAIHPFWIRRCIEADE